MPIRLAQQLARPDKDIQLWSRGYLINDSKKYAGPVPLELMHYSRPAGLHDYTFKRMGLF